MVVGEAPAKTEIRQGKCFVGKTGKELNNLLFKFLRVRRGDDWDDDEVYVTNIFKWELNDKKQFTAEDMLEAYTDLEDEIKEVDPDVILVLGALATHFFLGEGTDMEAVNSVPHEWEGRIVIPCFHPAAAFHTTALLQWIIEAFEVTKRVLDGEQGLPVKPVPFRPVPLHTLELGDIVAVDTETDKKVRPVMITVASGRMDIGGYVFLDGEEGSDAGLRMLKEHLEQDGVTTLLHNALFDLPVLARAGIFPKKWICTMQMAFLLQTLPQGLKALAYRLLGMEMQKYTSLVPKGKTVLDIPREDAIKYACEDAVATLGVYEAMAPMLTEGTWENLERDCAIMPMVIAMMARGIKIDVPFLKDLEVKMIMEGLEMLDEIRTMVDEPELNPGSSQQLSKLLYTKLGLGKGKRIKKTEDGGGSTDEKHRKKIEDEHPVVPLINKWKETITLVDKYLHVLPTLVAKDGRIHAQIQMNRVKHSGRFACKKPNLLAIPTRTEAGREIRNGYVAEDGYEFIACDFSQIEMRVEAHESQDAELMRVFLSGGDIHNNTAMRIFGLEHEDDIDKMKHRYPAKSVGFGILYGLTAIGLARELQAAVGPEWTEDRCQDLIDNWFDLYKGVRRHMNTIHAHARRFGYVEDMWGRRTYTPEVYSTFSRTREAGLRVAGNQPIQGGAAGVFKIAMQKLWGNPYIQEMYEKRVLSPLVPIHDDILWTCRVDHVPAAARGIQTVMEGAVTLSLPTPADPERGRCWGTMGKI